MGLFSKKGDAPPDVGKEDEYEAKKLKSILKNKKQEKIDKKESKLFKDLEKIKSKKASSKDSGNVGNIEVERMHARLDVIENLIKSYNERFSVLNQQVGEVRTMAINNEKLINKSTKDSVKAVDIVKELKPEELRSDYQRMDLKVQKLSEKLELEKQWFDSLMDEMKEIKRKSEIFVGTDGLINLIKDTKKDIVFLKKLSTKTKVNSDRAESIFIELKKNFADYEKLYNTVNNLDSSYSDVSKEVEKLKLNHSEIVLDDEFNDYKKILDKRMMEMENQIRKVNNVRKENQKLGNLVESMATIVKRNKDYISDISMSMGHKNLHAVSDYNGKLDSMLHLINDLADEIAFLKKSAGISNNHVSNHLETGKKKSDLDEEKNPYIQYGPGIEKKENIELSNYKIHKSDSKDEIVKKAQLYVSDAISKGYKKKDLLKMFKDKKWDKRTIKKIFKGV